MKHFQAEPPEDVWPTAEKPIPGSQIVRVDRRSAWIISKPQWPTQFSRRGPLFMGALATPLIVGIANPLDLMGPDFLQFYAVVCVVAIIVAWGIRHFCRVDSPTRDSRELSPSEIACLSGGMAGALRACLVSLIVDKRLKFATSIPLGSRPKSATADAVTLVATHKPATTKSPIEQPILELAKDAYGATLKQLLNAGLPAAEKIYSTLAARGLLESNESFAAARWWPILLLAIVWLLGLSKVVVGIDRNRPVGFLIAMVVGLTIVMALFWRRPLRTRQGERLFNDLRGRHQALKEQLLVARVNTEPDASSTNTLLLAAGLFGLASIAHPDVERLRKSLKPGPADAFGGGCGSTFACGGAGCGGGGCGGCGGS